MSNAWSSTALPHCQTPLKPSHPFNVFSVFKISKTLAPSDNCNYTFQGSTVSITCNGWEANHKIMLGTSITFAGKLNNNTTASGLGIVANKHEVSEPNSNNVMLAFVMTHLCENVNFKVKYHIRLTQKLNKSQSIMQPGKEPLVHSFIVDWDNKASRWIVNVTVLNVATRHEAPSKKHMSPGTKVTHTGRVHPANPSRGPPHPTDTSSGQQGKSSQLTKSNNITVNTSEPELAPEAGPSTPRPATSPCAAKKKTN
ncbi:hypothetical protein DFH28DRAFT_1085188 [Melampsora americana]|nr:hypothetical protein DFH28DRAFT_1085188 [Melampsora americana]